MNLDERLEALTHSVELLAQMHLDNDRRYEERFRRYEERFQRIETRFEKTLSAIEKLAQIAESHHRRLNDLEDRQ